MHINLTPGQREALRTGVPDLNTWDMLAAHYVAEQHREEYGEEFPADWMAEYILDSREAGPIHQAWRNVRDGRANRTAVTP